MLSQNKYGHIHSMQPVCAGGWTERPGVRVSPESKVRGRWAALVGSAKILFLAAASVPYGK